MAIIRNYRLSFSLDSSLVQENSINRVNFSYKDNKWLKFTFGLTFLDPNEVSDCLVDDFMSEIPDDSKYREYADYLVDNYIGENANFPPNIWQRLQLT